MPKSPEQYLSGEDGEQKKENNDVETFPERVKKFRLRNPYASEPVSISGENREIISEFDSYTKDHLNENYQPGFGVFPSAKPEENFYEQVWSRDFSHAAGNYFIANKPQAVEDSLKTILKYQRQDGMLPLRVERQFALLKVSPIPFLRPLAKPLFNLVEEGIKGRDERPVYEGQDGSGAEDTVPAVVIAAGEFFINSAEGKNFVEAHFDQLEKAVDFFASTKTDTIDGLAETKAKNPDWADSLLRPGKLGGINVLWTRSLRLMEYMARQLGQKDKAEVYRKKFQLIKENIIKKLYNKEEGYFRAAEGEDRIDTSASVFGALYLLNPEEGVRVEETLSRKMKHKSGLKNFDPPYPKEQIFLPLRIGNPGYHNEFVWPWVTLQNIQVKIKIALQHPDQKIRDQYKKEAVKDLLDTAKLFKKAGGAYEIFLPDEPKPATGRFYKHPPKNLMGNLAAYQAAYHQLKELGWI